MELRHKSKTKRGGTQLVVTGKRVKGTWIMESTLPPRRRRAPETGGLVATENHRVRTLH